jgi:Arc/MetJ-type ribon-helix-helix transcriptional regulator
MTSPPDEKLQINLPAHLVESIRHLVEQGAVNSVDDFMHHAVFDQLKKYENWLKDSKEEE